MDKKRVLSRILVWVLFFAFWVFLFLLISPRFHRRPEQVSVAATPAPSKQASEIQKHTPSATPTIQPSVDTILPTRPDAAEPGLGEGPRVIVSGRVRSQDGVLIFGATVQMATRKIENSKPIDTLIAKTSSD